MIDALSFLRDCETLTGGQSPELIFHKAIVLIEDPIYWCGIHKACIREHFTASDGLEYSHCTPCKINDPRATSVNIEGAVARACNNDGIIPPFLISYLDHAMLNYLLARGEAYVGTERGAWSPYDIGWFCELYGHDHSMNLLHEIYRSVSSG